MFNAFRCQRVGGESIEMWWKKIKMIFKCFIIKFSANGLGCTGNWVGCMEIDPKEAMLKIYNPAQNSTPKKKNRLLEL